MCEGGAVVGLLYFNMYPHNHVRASKQYKSEINLVVGPILLSFCFSAHYFEISKSCCLIICFLRRTLDKKKRSFKVLRVFDGFLVPPSVTATEVNLKKCQ